MAAHKKFEKEVKKAASAPKIEQIPVQPEPKQDHIVDSAHGCVICGEPLARGQTYVCVKHIRTN